MAQIRSIVLAASSSGARTGLGGGNLRVELEDGSAPSFSVATPDQPARWLKESGQPFYFGAPALFVRTLDREAVARAAAAMAGEMGGYWLRYYNSAAALAPNGSRKKKSRAR